ncbi:MAG TPA: 3-phosphoshikimate 1-carboxyvinyltransferase [Actinomycetes bacterium]|nr:3-phosphoshikimate 1-carboxyvinyltransferase [Actinomycetes bacterium]
MTDLWAAPVAEGPVDAVVTLPGSKSVTNRALVLAALADSASLIRHPLRARDTELMAEGLRRMGAEVEGESAWAVQPRRMHGADVDCGLAGTVMRFLPVVAGLADSDVRFDGDPRSHERPMGPLVDALRTLGVEVDDDGRGALPLTVRGRGFVKGGTVTLDASASSQFVSALLLVGPRFDEGLEVRHQGPPMPSAPHVRMSVSMLRAAGGVVDDDTPDVWRVAPGRLVGRDLDVEPDLSNAAPFLAAALVTGGRVTIPGWPSGTSQAGDALRELLASMGAKVSWGADGLTVSGTGSVAGIDADLHDVGELTPTLVALAVLASSPSRLRGIAHLRGHETDRLTALAEAFGGLGAEVRASEDGLEVRPRPLHGGPFPTYDDHRIATAGAVVGLVVPGVQVVDVATTAKTLPGFVDLWLHMLGR